MDHTKLALKISRLWGALHRGCVDELGDSIQKIDLKDIEMANVLLEKVYKMYRQKWIGKTHSNCLDCQKIALEKSKVIIGPVPIYHVGNNFTEDKYKILFLGAVAYGLDDVINKDWKDIYIGDPGYFGTCIKEMHETTKYLFCNFWNVIKLFCKKNMAMRMKDLKE